MPQPVGADRIVRRSTRPRAVRDARFYLPPTGVVVGAGPAIFAHDIYAVAVRTIHAVAVPDVPGARFAPAVAVAVADLAARRTASLLHTGANRPELVNAGRERPQIVSGQP